MKYILENYWCETPGTLFAPQYIDDFLKFQINVSQCATHFIKQSHAERIQFNK